MNRNIYLPALLSFAIFSGCATNIASKDEVAGVDRKVGDMRSFQAELTSQLSALQEEVGRLTGKVEELEYRLNRGATTPIAPAVTAPQLPGITPSAPPAVVATPSVVPLNELSEDEVWSKQLSGESGQSMRDALYFIRAGKLTEAQPILSQLASAGAPAARMNALFWLGVCYEGNDQVRNALGTYNEVMKNYPGQERSRVALLRIADIFAKLGDKGTARLTLQKLVTEAPKTRQADIAREKLKSF